MGHLWKRAMSKGCKTQLSIQILQIFGRAALSSKKFDDTVQFTLCPLSITKASALKPILDFVATGGIRVSQTHPFLL